MKIVSLEKMANELVENLEKYGVPGYGESARRIANMWANTHTPEVRLFAALNKGDAFKDHMTWLDRRYLGMTYEGQQIFDILFEPVFRNGKQTQYSRLSKIGEVFNTLAKICVAADSIHCCAFEMTMNGEEIKTIEELHVMCVLDGNESRLHLDMLRAGMRKLKNVMANEIDLLAEANYDPHFANVGPYTTSWAFRAMHAGLANAKQHLADSLMRGAVEFAKHMK